MSKLEMVKLTYEEKQALPVIRKLLKRNPDAAYLLMDGMAKEIAVNVLLQVKAELNGMMAVSRAMSTAAGELAKLDKAEV
jgi:hypothetical protein